MQWRPIKSSACCNRQVKPAADERLFRSNEPVPKAFRCRFPARWSGMGTGRELVLRCKYHHLIELLEQEAYDKVMNEMLDAKFFVMPYIELQTPVAPSFP